MKAVVACVVISTCFVSWHVNAKWDFSPSLSIQELYSSNIDLLPSDSREAELVSELSPSILILNNHLKSPVTLFYRAQGIHYAQSKRDNKIYQQALFHGHPSLFGEHLRFNIHADHGQTILFPSQTIAIDNSRGSQRTNVSRVLIGPEFSHKIGSHLKALWKYAFGHLIYQEGTNDVSTHQFDAKLESKSWHRLSMNTHIRWDQTVREHETLNEKIDGLFTLGYQLTQKLSPYASLGYEDNQGLSDLQSLNGKRWHIGLLYTPTRRLSLNGYYGRRSFGQDWMGRVTWFHKHQSLSASYEQSITNYFEDQLRSLQTTQPSDFASSLVQFQPELRNEVLIRKVISMQWGLTRKKVKAHLSPYYERRIPNGSSLKEEGLGVNADIVFQRTNKMFIVLLGGMSYQKLIKNQTDERFQMGIQIEQRLTPNIQLRYQFNHFEIHRTHTPTLREDMLSLVISAQP